MDFQSPEKPNPPQLGGGLTMRQWAILGQFVSQVGCGTVMMILIALAAGLWLDRQLASKPIFSLLCLLGSIPLTLYLIWMSWKTVARTVVPPDQSPPAAPSDSDNEDGPPPS